MPKFVVLGGAGAMGKVIVKDLFLTNKDCNIVIADYNLAEANKLAASYQKKHKSSRVKAAFADVLDIKKTAQLLKGAAVVINCVQYELNLHVMKAALLAKVHYIDLGGLFHMTRKQLKLHDKFKKANLLAVLGMGAAPGLTNVMAKYGANMLDKVDEVKIRIGGKDFTHTVGKSNKNATKKIANSPLMFSYSPQTILEEHTYKPMVFTKGKFVEVEPRTGKEVIAFPAPVGKRTAVYTLHSEVATLPVTLKHKGVKEVSFKISFPDEFEEKLNELIDLGLASRKKIKIGNQEIVPFNFLVKILNKLPRLEVCPVDVEIISVELLGKKKNKKSKLVLDAWFKSDKKWCVGAGDIDTASPASIVAQFIAAGKINERGCLPAESCVNAEDLFKELRKRGMKLKVKLAR